MVVNSAGFVCVEEVESLFNLLLLLVGELLSAALVGHVGRDVVFVGSEEIWLFEHPFKFKL